MFYACYLREAIAHSGEFQIVWSYRPLDMYMTMADSTILAKVAGWPYLTERQRLYGEERSVQMRWPRIADIDILHFVRRRIFKFPISRTEAVLD